MEAGARVEVAPYKKGPMDFVLWKPSKPGEPAWPSPCGIATPGRPGWHIECSAMAGALLGSEFDIHGGGIDLTFPHHENEIAQSRCAHGTAAMANVWMHNGFLQVEGEKMSKSLGNFVTINELLHTDKFGGRKWSGEVLRLAMLMTHYTQPLDMTVSRLQEATSRRTRWLGPQTSRGRPEEGKVDRRIIDTLCDDLNCVAAFSALDDLAGRTHSLDGEDALIARNDLAASLAWLGLAGDEDFAVARASSNHLGDCVKAAMIGVPLEEIQHRINARLDARKRKDFAESDRIRDELAKMGIALKDTKNKETGEIETTWEVAR
jgi:cysteinyl-tRNA synthetase